MKATLKLVAAVVQHISKLNVPVLITGETGTGKEVVARAIHEASGRRLARFGDVNCGTITETLFESVVFGHAHGAFTGAISDHTGLLEVCDGGTLFLDEIGELSLGNQVRLLRVLQDRVFNRLGETKNRSSNFRLVSATNRDLQSMVTEGLFRDDLFYRIAVFPIHLPPLRDRLGDLPQLVTEIIDEVAELVGPMSSMTAPALRHLGTYDWPGNIRELKNVVTRAAIMAEGAPIGLNHLPKLGEQASVQVGEQEKCANGKMQSLAEVEREHIARVLSAVEGNITAAATVLEISRTTLYKKLKDHGIELPGPPRRSVSTAK